MIWPAAFGYILSMDILAWPYLWQTVHIIGVLVLATPLVRWSTSYDSYKPESLRFGAMWLCAFAYLSAAMVCFRDLQAMHGWQLLGGAAFAGLGSAMIVGPFAMWLIRRTVRDIDPRQRK